MHELSVRYVADLRCEAVLDGEAQGIPMDAPVKYGGRGEAISPTEMVGAAVGCCMLTMIVIAGWRHDLDLSLSKIKVATGLSADRPPRIARLDVEVSVPVSATSEQRQAIEAASAKCPVRASIHPDIEVVSAFHWGAK
jgi:uncharacterized OsmC-like protein